MELANAEAAIEPENLGEVLALHEALEELEQVDPLKARIVHLRYFTGMNMKETADVLQMSERTLHRQWRFIKAWLRRRAVLDLLRHDEENAETGDFLVSPVTRAAERLRPSAASPEPAEMPKIAGFELLDVIGRGGMGVVYRAR